MFLSLEENENLYVTWEYSFKNKMADSKVCNNMCFKISKIEIHNRHIHILVCYITALDASKQLLQHSSVLPTHSGECVTSSTRSKVLPVQHTDDSVLPVQHTPKCYQSNTLMTVCYQFNTLQSVTSPTHWWQCVTSSTHSKVLPVQHTLDSVLPIQQLVIADISIDVHSRVVHLQWLHLVVGF